MLKKFLAAVLFLSISVLAAAAQVWPKAGIVQLKSGDYQLSVLPKNNGRISGFAYQGKELFISPSSSAGTQFSPARKEVPVSLKVTIDGQEPATVGKVLTGKKIVLERAVTAGDVTLYSSYTLTEDGLVWSIRYKLENPGTRPGYFYLFTMPWRTSFTQFIYSRKGAFNSGKLTNSGSWVINTAVSGMAIYDPASQISVVTIPRTAIPTEIRHHSIWDHKSYHKYYLFLKRPSWKEDVDSPEYILEIKAFKAPADQWQSEAEKSMTSSAEKKSPDSGAAEPVKTASSTLVKRPVPPVDEAVAAEEEKDWLVNRRGIEGLDDDFILPPFSPIDFKNSSASVWGREYTFSKFNLLEKVKILGENFLACPMEFSAVVNGKKVNFKTGKQILLREHKGVVELYTRANSKDVDIEVRTTIEYDGMIKVDFTFDPRGSVQIDKFSYTITYPEKYAQFIHYTGARDGGYSLNVPRLSNTRRLPEGEGTVWESPFKILVWLGSYDRGLLWFCESEKNWSPHDRKARKEGLAVIRKDGLVKLQITPVSQPKLIGKPATYTFGLMATPVRPRTPGWRGTDMDYENIAEANLKNGIKTPVIYSSASYDYLPNDPKRRNPAAAGFYPRIYNVEAYRARVEKAHAMGSVFGIYIDPILCNFGIYKDMADYQTNITSWDPTTDNADASGTKIEAPMLWQAPEVKKYFLEWRREPVSTAPYGRNLGERQFQAGLGSRYADMLCYFLEKHAALGCDGIANLDEWGPVPDANARHDMGYYELDGKRYPEYDWFGRRDLLKRMCAIFYKKHGRLPIMRVHLAATLVVPIASFCDSVVTGENINSAYFNGASLMDKYTVNREGILKSINGKSEDFLYYTATPDRWAIEYGGQAFGWNVCVMSNLRKSPQLNKEYAFSDIAARDYLAMCLLHDNTLWPVFCNPKSARKVLKIKQDFRIGDEKVKFYPYWGETHPVSVSGKEAYAVTWENGNDYLVAVANLARDGQKLTVALNKEFFPGKAEIINAESGEKVALNGGEFSFELSRRNFNLFIIKK
ncbi:MAG: hypothetical protein IJW33_05255 [Lentisphaeria bacterium]|nr:hypothetical protein [Lentisphaeria bacterium]